MDMQGVMEPVGDMVSLIGTEGFGPGFFGIMDRLIGIDHCTVFVSSENELRALVAEANTEKSAD